MKKGNGTVENPFLIDSEATLRKVGSGKDGWSLSAHYRLATDINLSNKDWDPIGTWDDKNTWLQKPFIGTFDGNGKTISNLYVNNSSKPRQGLFGYIGENSIVKNLTVNGRVIGNTMVGGIAGTNSGTVQNCYSNVSITGNEWTGGVVGRNNSTIRNCSFTGNISGKAVTVGGVVGFNSGIVENCNSSGSINGKLGIGGVVGHNNANGTVKNSYYTGYISSSGEGVVSGVVGLNEGMVDNCYSTGEATGEDRVGGVVGSNEGTIKNSYSIGKISGRESVGGVTGSNIEKGTVENCYFTGKVTGRVNGAGGLVGFNVGIVKNSCSIGNINGKKSVGGVVGLNSKVIINCSFGGNVTGDDSVGGVAGSNIEASTVKNSYSNGKINGDKYIGGVVGTNNEKSTIENGYSNSNVTGNDTVGGISGSNVGTVQNCYATGNVTGNKTVGGVSGLNGKGIMKNCVALNNSISRTNGTDNRFGCLVGDSVVRVFGGNLNDYFINNHIRSGIKFIDGTILQANFPYPPNENQPYIENQPDITSTQVATKSWWTDASGLDWDFVTVWQWDSIANLPVLTHSLEDMISKEKKRQYDQLIQDKNNISTEREYKNLANKFRDMGDYENAAELAKECDNATIKARYNQLVQDKNDVSTEEEYKNLANKFRDFGPYENTAELAKECENEAVKARYNQLIKEKSKASCVDEYKDLASKFRAMGPYEKATELANDCEKQCKVVEERRHEEYVEFEAKEKKKRIRLIIFGIIILGLIFWGMQKMQIF